MFGQVGPFFRNGWPRMKKDARVIMWPLLFSIAVGPAIVSYAFIRNELPTFDMWFGMFIAQFLAFNFMSASLFGHEFGEKTMEHLLSQPVTRFVVWNEKLLVGIVGLGICLLWNALLLETLFRNLETQTWPSEGYPRLRDFLFVALLAATTGPWLSIKGRNTFEGMIAAMGTPYIIFMAIFAYRLGLITLDGRWITPDEFTFFGGFELGIPWACLAYWLGWREFRKLEV